MNYLSKISIRILPWDPWLPRCSENLTRFCQESRDASERVNPGCVLNRNPSNIHESSRACQDFRGIVHNIHMFKGRQTEGTLQWRARLQMPTKMFTLVGSGPTNCRETGNEEEK